MNRLAILENNLEFSRKLVNNIMSGNKKVQLTNISVNLEEIKETIDLLDKRDILLCERLKDYAYDIIKNTNSFNKIVNVINQITYIADEQFYERLIKDELDNFEMNITTFGYDYIVEGITLSLEDGKLLKDFQNGLYQTLATNHNLPRNYNIKWAVEKCIKATVRYTDFEIIKEYFHVETAEKVTPKLFISIIVENLKNKMMQNLVAQIKSRIGLPLYKLIIHQIMYSIYFLEY